MSTYFWMYFVGLLLLGAIIRHIITRFMRVSEPISDNKTPLYNPLQDYIDTIVEHAQNEGFVVQSRTNEDVQFIHVLTPDGKDVARIRIEPGNWLTLFYLDHNNRQSLQSGNMVVMQNEVMRVISSQKTLDLQELK